MTEMGSYRILVIDDEEIVHSSLRRLLSGLSSRVEAAFSVRDGLKLLQHHPFDLIISDVLMPEIDGMQLLRTLWKKGSSVPVIMITGYPTVHSGIDAVRLGATDYIAKPFTRKELLGPVMRALRSRNGFGVPIHPGEGVGRLTPGTILFMPHHAWARYEQDGTFLVGVEHSLLRGVGGVNAVRLPEVGERLQQGNTAISIVSEEGEEHGVAAPLSGKVSFVRPPDAPGQLSSDRWLVRIHPTHVPAELRRLVRRDPVS